MGGPWARSVRMETADKVGGARLFYVHLSTIAMHSETAAVLAQEPMRAHQPRSAGASVRAVLTLVKINGSSV